MFRDISEQGLRAVSLDRVLNALTDVLATCKPKRTKLPVSCHLIFRPNGCLACSFPGAAQVSLLVVALPTPTWEFPKEMHNGPHKQHPLKGNVAQIS